MLELSIIIPAYNEEKRLPKTLESVCRFMRKQGRSFEVIVVDDGSDDNTANFVSIFTKDYPEVRLVSYQPNKGKGYAVRAGMLTAKGNYLLINDADSSSPIEELERLEQAIAQGADLAIGSRAKPDESRTVEALPYRKFIGNTFNFIVQSLLLPGIYDSQCGFKLFKRSVAHDIFSVNRINGFGFDVEVLYIAKIRGYKTQEIAINWANKEGSKVNVLIDSPKMFFDVLTVSFWNLCGLYKRRSTVTPPVEGLVSMAERKNDNMV